ncbi:MAG: GNAT family N-acetyltransferase [Desulfobacterales bacterium]|nr:GNAT family N-acetyltransferase [Desulfobacterales bacterium]
MKNITIVSKEGRHVECFTALQKRGLIGYSTSGYKRWHWQYIENPFWPSCDISAWLYKTNGEAVGHIGTIPVQLHAGSKKINAAWAVDFMTLSQYRRKGIGRALVNKISEHFDILMAIGITEMSFRLFMKMGWRHLGNIPYYIMVWDCRGLLKKKIDDIFILNLVSIPVNLLLKVFNASKKLTLKIDVVEVRRIDSFDKEPAEFFNETTMNYQILVTRNKSYLNWKYDRQPDMNYVKLKAVDGKKPCGYSVIRCIKCDVGKPEGLIVDIIAPPDDRTSIKSLVLASLEYFKKEGCSLVRCYASHKGIQKALLSCGMIRRKSDMRFLISKDIVGLNEHHNLGNWHITSGDCDIDRI